MTDESLQEEVKEAVEAAVASIPKNAPNAGGVNKWIIILGTIGALATAGVGTVRTFKEEIVGLVCESTIELAEKDKKNALLEAEAECNRAEAHSVTLQTLHLQAATNSMICYSTAARIMSIDDQACRDEYAKGLKIATDYQKSLED